MSVIKIFDRKTVCDNMNNSDDGLININDIINTPYNTNNEPEDDLFNKEININFKNIILSFVQSNTFLVLLEYASKLCGINPDHMVGYYTFSSDPYRGWYVHPILIKSILRHFDVLFDKCVIIRIIYGRKKWIGLHKLLNCSLTQIVENVKMPEYIETVRYDCVGIKNKEDMFNDDHLILEFVKPIIKETLIFLPECLCDIICFYYLIDSKS
jgi:hypothetical protein